MYTATRDLMLPMEGAHGDVWTTTTPAPPRGSSQGANTVRREPGLPETLA